jgi:hypothetical protein
MVGGESTYLASFCNSRSRFQKFWLAYCFSPNADLGFGMLRHTLTGKALMGRSDFRNLPVVNGECPCCATSQRRPDAGTVLRMVRSVSSVCGLCVATSAWVFFTSGAHAQSNGYSEDGNWRFETTADTANKGSVQQLIEIKKANGFASMNSYDISYNIDGDYINCSVSSNVTGNQGAIDQNAPIGSPTLTSTPSFSASSIGNSNDTAVDSTDNQSGISSSNLIPVGVLDGTIADGNSMLSGSNQNLSDSALTASVSDSSSGFSVGSASGNGGGGSVVLNSAQSNDGANLSASVSDSQACAFSRVTGNGVANAAQ